jgi:Tol biopolymer transport system component/predicted Ser/Thr protein kinase
VIGTTLLHYRILDRLGRGGMGEVFVAEDTKLRRKVALKVLPPDLARDPARRARFEREATSIAALNHPNIVTIHSVEQAEGLHFLTMELVEGKPLRQVIPKEGLPLARFFDLAIPLADALASAHRHGIIHRDLKPDNIVVGDDGRLRVLDFGLAKLKEGTEAPQESQAPTRHLTEDGQVLGTVAYMAPEQLEGKEVDHRSDIFSLGIVLHEMVTGDPPFQGDSKASVISSILRDTPRPVSEITPGLPRHLGRIIRHCLAKDPDQRIQTALDVRNQLTGLRGEIDSGELSRETLAAGRAAPAPNRRALFVALAAGGAAVALILSLLVFARLRPAPGARQSGAAPPQGNFLRLTEQSGVEEAPSISPDGKVVAYASPAAGNYDIYVQRVGGTNAINLTRDSVVADNHPAFSPDGERIAFRSERGGGGIFVMGATGESVLRLTDGGHRPAWSPDGEEIAYSTQTFVTPYARPGASEVWAVNVRTREKRRVAEADAIQPAWSPHGKRVAFWGLAGGGGRRDIWTVAASGGTAVPVTSDAPLEYNPVWSPDGRFLYFSSDRGGSMNIWRVPIDEENGRVLGPPEAITRGASADIHSVSVSRDGMRLAYVASSATNTFAKAGFDPVAGRLTGEPEPILRTTTPKLWPDISPDGQWLAHTSVGGRDATGLLQEEIIVSRLDGTSRRKILGDAHKYRMPRWSPDGKRIAFFSDRAGKYQIWAIDPDGTGLSDLTDFPDATTIYPVWSPDGGRVAFAVREKKALHVVEVGGGSGARAPEPVGKDVPGGGEYSPSSWSPDGRRIAGFVNREDGETDGIVLFDVGTKRFEKVSDEPGIPIWLSDSRRILFVNERTNRLKLLDTRSGQSRELYAPRRGELDSFSATISKDDRTVLVGITENEADVWLLELAPGAAPAD